MNNSILKIDFQSVYYPEKLRGIPKPPQQLFCVGDISLLNEKSVGVVGSRKFTVYGKQVSMMIGRRLADSGIPVVSGLAYGIDAFAHQGTLQGNGKCIAVLGSGFNKMSPEKNKMLMKELLDEGGLVVSEYEPDFSAEPWTFPQRNRIISGLSDALIVVEANYNSGSLITAQHANEQGRTVFSVPGNINSQFSLGSNLLIRDGAIPLVVVDDVIREVCGEVALHEEKTENLGPDEIKIINIVKKYNGITPDKLSEELNQKVSKINAIVTIMEIKGVVEVYSGKIHLAK